MFYRVTMNVLDPESFDVLHTCDTTDHGANVDPSGLARTMADAWFGPHSRGRARYFRPGREHEDVLVEVVSTLHDEDYSVADREVRLFSAEFLPNALVYKTSVSEVR